MQGNHKDEDNNALGSVAKGVAIGAVGALAAAGAAILATNPDAREEVKGKVKEGAQNVVNAAKDAFRPGAVERMRAEIESFIEEQDLEGMGKKAQAAITKKYDELKTKLDDVANDTEGKASDLFDDARTAWDELRAEVEAGLEGAKDEAENA